MVGCPIRCKAMTDTLLHEYGIYVQPINYPTVSKGTERMRLTPSPTHTDKQMAHLVHALTSSIPLSTRMDRFVRFDEAVGAINMGQLKLVCPCPASRPGKARIIRYPQKYAFERAEQP